MKTSESLKRILLFTLKNNYIRFYLIHFNMNLTFRLSFSILVYFCFVNDSTNVFAQAGHTARIIAMDINKEGKLVSSSNDGTVILWDEMAKKIRTYSKPMGQYSETKLIVTRLTFFKDSNCFMVSSLMEGYIGKSDNSELTSLNTGYMTSFYGLALTSDNQYLLAANNNYSGLTVKTIDGKKVNSLSGVIQDIYPFPHDPKKFLAQSAVGGISVLDVNGNNYANFPLLKKEEPIAMAPDGNGFFCMNTYYPLNAEKTFSIPEKATTVCFSPDSKKVYTSNANKISIWSKEGKLLSTIEYKNSIATFVLTTDGNAIVVGDTKGGIEMLTLKGVSVLQYK